MRRLTPREETRIRRCVEDEIQFFSPTISPAPKHMERQEIESILGGLKYYYDAGVKRCILQPKYMGSYVDIYLSANLEETRFFSRNGYPISERMISRQEMLAAVESLHQRFDWNGVSLRIIQAELLPWAALGRGLIDDNFGGYGICHQDHANYLKNSPLKGIIQSLLSSKEFHQYLKDVTTLDKKVLDKKYPHHIVQQYESLRYLKLPESSSYQNAIDLFKQQLDLYGQEGPLEFRPFNLLKVVLHSESRENISIFPDNNIENFRTVSDDQYLVVELTEENIQAGFPEAYEFFNNLVSTRQMEGIIIKPEQVWVTDLPPAFKVRNNSYLQMIYGVRFNAEYDGFLDRRKVGKKIKCSINEWNIAQSLIRIPMGDIGKEEYRALIEKRILEEDYEVKLDARL